MLAGREGERDSALRIRAPLRDLMDWNGAKVEHVIASTTRLAGGNPRAKAIFRTSFANAMPICLRRMDPCLLRVVLSELVARLPATRADRSVEQ